MAADDRRGEAAASRGEVSRGSRGGGRQWRREAEVGRGEVRRGYGEVTEEVGSGEVSGRYTGGRREEGKERRKGTITKSQNHSQRFGKPLA